MSIRFLALLIRPDHPFPTSGIRVIVNYLTHDLLAIRKVFPNTSALLFIIYI